MAFFLFLVIVNNHKKFIRTNQEKERDDLFDELEDMKTNEKRFMDKLIKKYGESEVTPYKLLQVYENSI